MSVKEIAKPGKLPAQFLARFAYCFARPAGRGLLKFYLRVGSASDVRRENVEAIALDQKVATRTPQRLLESIACDEQTLRDRCQQVVSADHAHPEAIGCIDETGTAKSGKLVSKQCTLIVARDMRTGEMKNPFRAIACRGGTAGRCERRRGSPSRHWRVEDCFREAKEEPGLDHFECRGWRCIHRHLHVAITSQLFRARVRRRRSKSGERPTSLFDRSARLGNVASNFTGTKPTGRSTKLTATPRPPPPVARDATNALPNSELTPKKSNPFRRNTRTVKINPSNPALSG